MRSFLCGNSHAGIPVFLLVLLFIVSFQVHAQDPSGAQGSRLAYIDLIPPSPAVSSLGNINRPDVGMISGAAQVTVPITNISRPGITVPVSLSYSSNGVRVDEISSRVGTGWQLEAGGAITRSVQGNGPDEETNYHQPPPQVAGSDFNRAFMDYVYLVGIEGYDAQPEMFSYSFCGISGKFFLNENNEIVQVTKTAHKIYKDFGGAEWNFKIVDDKGNEFYFGGPDIEKSKQAVTCSKEGKEDYETTAWFLHSIKLYNGEYVFFNYDPVPEYTYDLSVNQSINYAAPAQVQNANGGCSCPDYDLALNTCVTSITVKTKVLRSISSKGKAVSFTPEGRSDCGDYRYSHITVTSEGNFKEVYRLIYNGFNSPSFEHSQQAELVTHGPLGGRFYLASIYRITGDVWNKYYAFSYNYPGGVPRRLSFAQDHWGFTNAKTNKTLIPTQTGYQAIQFPSISGDRSVDTLASNRGMLIKVHFPTGGYDSITYEPQQSSTGLGGGVRVKRIQSFTADGKLAQSKRFRYASVDYPNISSGSQLQEAYQYMKNIAFTFFCVSGGLGCQSDECGYTNLSSTSLTNLFTSSGSSVAYHTVTEFLEGPTDVGAIEHKFIVSNDANGELMMGSMPGGGLITNSSVYNHGKEVQTSYYKKTSGGYELVSRTKNHYKTHAELKDTYYGVLVSKAFNNPCGLPQSGWPSEMEKAGLEVTRYRIDSRWLVLDSTTQETYANGQLLKTVTTYAYNDTLSLRPTTITSTDHLDRTEIITNYYPTMRALIPGLSGSQSSRLGTLISKNNISPVVYEKSMTGSAINSIYKLEFDSFNGLVLPAEVKIYNKQDVVQGGGFTIMKYDSSGNILQRRSNDGVITSYLWDYHAGYVTAEFKNAEHNRVAATSFESNEKGNWTVTGTSEFGLTPPSGKKCLHLGSLQYTFPAVEDDYYLSYWYKAGSVISITGATVISESTVSGPDGWSNRLMRINPSTTLTISGTGYVDDVRLYPADATVTTFTYEPSRGLSSISDVNNKLQYFEYDAMGRLRAIRDHKKNLLKTFNYKLNEPNGPDHTSGIPYVPVE